MQVSITEAKANLADLLHRAEAGEEVIVTRRGKQIARIVAVRPSLTTEQRRAIIEEVRAMAPPTKPGGPPAARSQDFLYDEDGLPG
ncbi:type II toxin-antitoxin system prevent-host-death family antitoxin [Rhizobium sp. CG5]|uniref:type II toxin-antitoxin system Phd/YefM family antitoxin n=1 Tax=Rhizobium sp. CG5 TaxID=2726076 RepID=UPI002033BA3B|nr:type II toxin-antitoxin system prevent-host-death family antitoxin [Rhizobium sp. CG5]MCM2475888.1 type II toxin-antitoxin system prevent-host-death family antitoxin [Rhizobium sp. CG5]